MNKVILLGRLTAKPELRYTTNNVPVATFSLAVQRNFKNQDGNYDADFINCYAFRKTGELIVEHFDKGSKILVTGSIRVDNYEADNGDKKQSIRVGVETFDFVESSKKNDSPAPVEVPTENDPFSDYGEQITIDDTKLLPDDFLD